ncbi:hypothetical protein LCGC14_0843180 [marine sediment metagenome]|uniref:Disease resistance R13L4/SHOC-2-like LRR domain-containing protein n=1 Tax=marine sediment metagenome TaxID=412755 RepID=A0A0F9SJN9_9ZZZZ|nr:MAG: leucine-rich repeat domain protein [Candidatus Lokiarchaeum sp. GC14_75]HEC38923.1 leucine-rich repeat domain-containing protein [bacterium]
MQLSDLSEHIMQEFKVNNYITLKLESKKTNIYVKGEFFEQCKFLLLNIPTQDIDLYTEIESIDEIAENLGWTEERQLGVDYEVTPETEFFGHCSNLQAWVENNYNTTLLHRNLAFSLLKKLTELGDPVASNVFKEEISKRLASGFPSVIEYLTEEGYDSYLSREEYLSSFLKIRDSEALLELEEILHVKFYIREDLNGYYEENTYNRICIKSKNVVGLAFFTVELTNSIIKILKDLKTLKILHLTSSKIEFLGELIPYIKKLDDLRIFCDEINEVPKSIGIISNLKILIISGEIAQPIPSSIRRLKSLKVLSLRHNKLMTLPKSIGSLDSLERLDLVNNPLNKLVETIRNLHSLKELVLDEKQAREKKNTQIVDFLKKKGVKITIV